MKRISPGGAALSLAVLLTLARPASAQGTLNDVIAFLMTNQAVPTADFERDRAAAVQASDTLSRALLVNLTSVPIATSSSGFLYRLNPQLGTVERATQSFGAFFVERALTPGRGHASFGVSASTSVFDHLDGLPLRDGTLLTIANQFRDEPAPFDTEALTLRVRSSTMTVLASVGMTDRFELGAAVPFARLTIDGQRVNVYRGQPFVQASAAGTASGLADIALRAKYTVLALGSGGVAAAGEVRLPTGDERNLLGAGSMAWRALAIGSVDHGAFSLHANGGIVRGGISDEETLAAAASYAPGARVTITGEMLTRHVSELRRMMLASAAHPTIGGVDTLRLVAGESGTTLTTAIAGVKWNVAGTVVLGGHLAWALTDAGLTARMVPTVTLEYALR
jgi:hypothetical protein